MADAADRRPCRPGMFDAQHRRAGRGRRRQGGLRVRTAGLPHCSRPPWNGAVVYRGCARLGVPVLYAGETEEVAISESVLHDLPSRAARLVASAYVDRLTGAVAPRRNLRFAQLHSGGLIRLGITPDPLPTPARSTMNAPARGPRRFTLKRCRWAGVDEQAVEQPASCDALPRSRERGRARGGSRDGT